MADLAPPARHRLADARQQRGWSQETLAALLRGKGLGTTRKTVTRWERGVTPDAAAQRALRDLFEVAHDVRASWPHWLPTGAAACATETWDQQGTVNALDDVAKGALVDRREFLILTGAELLLPVYEWRINPEPWIAAQQRGRHVGSALVTELQQLIAARRRMDDEHGGAVLLDALHADFQFVTGLLKNGTYSADVGRGLYGTAAEIARLAGWAAFDSGQHAAAQAYYLAALRSASAIGDRALGVNIVGFMAIQAYATGRLTDATKLMDTAAAEPARIPEVVQAMTWARLGRAYAKVDDPATARVALTRAGALLNRAVSGDAPPWAYWLDEARITAQLGRALYDLGDYAGSERELVAAATSCGDRYPRDRATWLGRVATAQLRRGRMDEGCATARTVVDLLADQADTDRGMRLLRTFRAELAARGPSTTAREFDDYAARRLAPAS
ncbi:helix-turn-helix domain-containing protein [Nonomuraea sp. CA-143628]|uniref:helix-turn-helix domain-containing protein n=1 Tax=Nonomuraea sp. CA-143628 TaxID=3239997 RepID=UPI003D8C2AEA